MESLRAQLITYTYVLAAAEELVLPITSEFVRCLANTGSFDIAIDDRPATANFNAGRRYRAPAGVTFQQVRLINTSGAANTITLAFGIGDLADDSITLTGAVTNTPTVGAFSTIADLVMPAAAVTPFAAGNPSRRQFIIQSNVANANAIRIGDAAVGAAEGLELQPGDTLILETTSGISGYNPAGAVTTVHIAEII